MMALVALTAQAMTDVSRAHREAEQARRESSRLADELAVMRARFERHDANLETAREEVIWWTAEAKRRDGAASARVAEVRGELVRCEAARDAATMQASAAAEAGHTARLERDAAEARALELTEERDASQRRTAELETDRDQLTADLEQARAEVADLTATLGARNAQAAVAVGALRRLGSARDDLALAATHRKGLSCPMGDVCEECDR
ncbi:hypothetical protein GTY96_11745 [Corallococcus sp. c25j21]|nr:hypothetical protein [Corallococcus silvisoli]